MAVTCRLLLPAACPCGGMMRSGGDNGPHRCEVCHKTETQIADGHMTLMETRNCTKAQCSWCSYIRHTGNLLMTRKKAA